MAQTATPPITAAELKRKSFRQRFITTVIPLAIIYGILLLGQQAGFEPGRIIREIADNPVIIIQQLIVGVSNAAIICIIALGYTLVYGIVENINFAHSSVFMLGTFVALLSMSFMVQGATTMPLWVALVSFIPAMLFCGALNGGIERYVYRSLRRSPRIVGLIAGLGMDYILINIGLKIGDLGILPNAFPDAQALQFLTVLGLQSATPKSFPVVAPFYSSPGIPVNLLEIFDPNAVLRLTPADVLVVATAIILVVALRYFVRNTRSGKAMRAVAQNPAAAAMMGINVDQTINLTYVIGGVLAGAAAVMFGIYNGTTGPTVGATTGLNSFTAAVLGGVGNIMGAAVGAGFIGILSALSDQFISSRWTSAWVFLTLVLVLIFRPTGILGSETGEKA